MSAGTKEKKAKAKEKVEVLGPTYEAGKPNEPIRWRQKLRNRDEMLKYLQTAERYWFGQGYGSEKRRTDA
jgi:hypothetical protein